MGCNCIYIGRLQAVSCFVPPDNDYYTSATSGSPARSDRKRRQILQKIMLRGLFGGCSSFFVLYTSPEHLLFLSGPGVLSGAFSDMTGENGAVLTLGDPGPWRFWLRVDHPVPEAEA